jgi:hypothetical protein
MKPKIYYPPKRNKKETIQNGRWDYIIWRVDGNGWRWTRTRWHFRIISQQRIKSNRQPIRILLESSAEMETSCDDDAVVYFGPLLWPTTTQWPFACIHSPDKCLSALLRKKPNRALMCALCKTSGNFNFLVCHWTKREKETPSRIQTDAAIIVLKEIY